MGFAKRKTLGTIFANILNNSSEILCGKSNWSVLKKKIEKYQTIGDYNYLYNCIVIITVHLSSAPPQDADSIINPLAHLKTNSALRMHQGTVISSVISWRKSTGMVSVLTSWRLAVFRIFLRPRMTWCLELISVAELRLSSSVTKWKMTCDCRRFECLVMKKSPVFSLERLPGDGTEPPTSAELFSPNENFFCKRFSIFSNWSSI